MITNKIKILSDRAKKTLQELLKRLDDKRPVWKMFYSYYIKEIIPASFDSEGQLMNQSSWKELTPKYKAWKDQHYAGKTMLKLTGSLYNRSKNAKAIYKKESLTMEVTGLPYIQVHQEGGSKMPQRPFFYTKDGDIPNRAYASLIQITNKYLEDSDNDK